MLGREAALLLLALVAAARGQAHASNCILGGGGSEPTYWHCEGCQVAAAVQCLQDMRNNATGNVANGCDINAITIDQQPECCPQFGVLGDSRTVDPRTTAYSDALYCFAQNGCGATHTLYEMVSGECLHNGCSWCQPTFSAAAGLRPAAAMVAAAVGLMWAVLL